METSRSERKGTSVNAVSGVRFVGIDWWPGGGLGIALKPGLGCAIIISLVGFSAAGATNEWTKSTSGSWEESYWSLGQLPGMNQELVAFRNPGWKALAIGANTTANYPASLSLNNLLVEAPTDSFNQLLLDWAGLSVPLVVHSNLKIGANGSLASHYSGLHAANAYIDGSASFSDYSTEEFAQLWLRSGATLNLTNGTMTCSNLPFYTATFTQSGGTHIAQIINLPVISSDLSPSGIYYLQGGALISAQVWMGAGGGYGPEGLGTVWQTGGVHTNFELEVGGWVHHGGSIHLGSYRLDGGLLASSNVDVYGSFSQGGGTNVVQQLNVGEGGDFWLSGGELITSNATVYRDPNVVNQGFVQTEGVHTVRGRLLIEGWPYGDSGSPSYTLMGGKLVTAANIEINSGALCISSHGVVLNTGMLTLSGGTLVGDNASETQYLGQLQCARGNLDMRPRYGTGTNATVLSQALLLDSTSDRFGAATFGTFIQSGGVHTNFGITLYNRSSSNAKGSYILDGGLLVSTFVNPYAGSFAQHGGTNIIGELVEEGYFTLDGGQLVSSNTTVFFSTFLQSGGTHIVSSNLVIGAGYEYEGGSSTYDLLGGNLVTSNIDINTGTLRLS